jgi:hypothetical protein
MLYLPAALNMTNGVSFSLDNQLYHSVRMAVKILKLMILQQNFYLSPLYLSHSVMMKLGCTLQHMMELWHCRGEVHNLVGTCSEHARQLLVLEIT